MPIMHDLPLSPAIAAKIVEKLSHSPIGQFQSECQVTLGGVHLEITPLQFEEGRARGYVRDAIKDVIASELH